MKKIIIFISICFITQTSTLFAQSLASNRTKAQSRYNKEKSFADAQRKLYSITSWTGESISTLLKNWGNFTKRSEWQNGIQVYTFENKYSGSGGTYDPGYVVTDQFGNILAQKAGKDNTYSYNFTDYFEFYVDKNQNIIHVKTGTR